MNNYIIGIDGGATKTFGVLVDGSGNTLAKANQTGTNLSLPLLLSILSLFSNQPFVI